MHAHDSISRLALGPITLDVQLSRNRGTEYGGKRRDEGRNGEANLYCKLLWTLTR